MHKQVQNGYVALISMIIIGAIVLILALSLTFITISQTQNMIGQNQALKSYYLANACAHYALTKLQDNINYTGNETVTIDNYACQVEKISGTGNYNRVITSSSNEGNHLIRVESSIAQIKPKTIIRFWSKIIY